MAARKAIYPSDLIMFPASYPSTKTSFPRPRLFILAAQQDRQRARLALFSDYRIPLPRLLDRNLLDLPRLCMLLACMSMTRTTRPVWLLESLHSTARRLAL